MLLSKYKIKHKYLCNRKKKNAGRNNTGRITVAHQGGGHKQTFRQISFKPTYKNGFVTAFEYDPNRTARLAKICFFENFQKKYAYILAPQNLKILDIIENNTTEQNSLNIWKLSTLKQVGSCYFLKDFSIGDYIYNIEINLKHGAQFVRAGGTSAVVLQKSNEHVTIKLPSGEHRLVPSNCKAFFGNLANENHLKVIWKKAGKSRWLNIRPTVRGVAKNPIDHPHGGNTSGGCHPVTPWARLTKGKPTRKKKINKLILKRSKNHVK